MTVTEILQFADQLVFAKRGKHLDNLQESIIKGVWEDQTYQEIADECNRSESRVRNVASQLWKLLSEELGENLEKDNFRSTFNRLNISSSQNQHICHVSGSNHSFNNNPSILYNSNQDNQENVTNTKSKSDYHDLTLAPKIINFYNRESELKTLSNCILNQPTRLISVLGLSGIGKTTMVKKFVDLNLQQFEVIVWKNLKFPKSLELLVNYLLNVCQQEPKETIDDKLKQLFDIFTQKKCLILLDDFHSIFAKGQFHGQYQTEYQDYQNFLTMITEVEHQSHVILISEEQCAEMQCLDEELYPIKCLELSGLFDVEIFKNTGLKDEGSWSNLIDLYEGNPMYLKDVAILIKDIFDGNVAEFLAENSSTGILPVVTNKIRSRFNQLFNRLSPIEQQLVLELSKIDQPLSIKNLRESLDLYSMDLINGLQSLQNRYLVKKIKAETILFDLSPAFKEYVRNCCKE